jgi:hypothetical protein
MGASNGLLMAVKQVELPKGNTPNDERKKSMLTALEHEIALLKNLQHENIVQYLCEHQLYSQSLSDSTHPLQHPRPTTSSSTFS